MIQYFQKKLRNKKGFTLVELLLVIAILGIIAGVAVPRVLNANLTTRYNADQATARMIVSKLEAMVLLGEIDTAANDTWYAITDASAGDLDYQEDVPTSQNSNVDFYIAISENAAGIITIVVTDVVGAVGNENIVPAPSAAYVAGATTFASGQAQTVGL